MLEVSVQVVGRSATRLRLRVSGEIDLATVATLDDQLGAVVYPPVAGQRVIVDSTGVGFLSASGVRVFVAFAERLRAHGGCLVVDAASPVVDRVLRMCGHADLLGAPEGDGCLTN